MIFAQLAMGVLMPLALCVVVGVLLYAAVLHPLCSALHWVTTRYLVEQPPEDSE